MEVMVADMVAVMEAAGREAIVALEVMVDTEDTEAVTEAAGREAIVALEVMEDTEAVTEAAGREAMVVDTEVMEADMEAAGGADTEDTEAAMEVMAKVVGGKLLEATSTLHHILSIRLSVPHHQTQLPLPP